MRDYLIIAFVITFGVPIFGIALNIVEKIIYFIFAELFGGIILYLLVTRGLFVGVIHHECSHALGAILTGAKVNDIVFFPKNGPELGYVISTPRGNKVMQAIQRTVIATSPVFFGALSVYFLYYLLTTVAMPTVLVVLCVYLLVSILAHMTMSHQDFKVMWKGIPIVFLLVFIAVVVIGTVMGYQPRV